MAGKGRLPNTPESFMAKVYPCPMSGCWLWAGSVCSGGHGQLKVNYVAKMAHRYSYEIHVGPIPEGLVLDHLCCNRLCVNPAHLRPCTDRENILAPHSQARAKKFADRQTCGCGLSFTLDRNGVRTCVPCRKARDRRYNAQHRAEKKAYNRALYLAQRETRIAKQKAYYEAHREEIQAKRKANKNRSGE